uniref:Amino acid transporter-like protein n=1 Tax=Oryza sativa subsp. japonica TaxID=39947 RepID=Q69MI3_ORYSJ|nr:amino acid transporter-like protein [Oryza sativa Japonica Group]
MNAGVAGFAGPLSMPRLIERARDWYKSLAVLTPVLSDVTADSAWDPRVPHACTAGRRRGEEPRASFSGAVFNLSTTIIGAGIMALPATMKVLSLVPGLILVMLAAVLTDASIELLVWFSRAVGATSYGEAMGDAFDPLKYTPAVSVALAVVFVVITVGIATIKLMKGQIPMPKLFPDVHDWSSTWRLPTAAPVLVSLHTIHNELKDHSLIRPIVRASLLLGLVVYTTTSFFGFLLFGEATLDDMLVFPIVFRALRFNMDGLLFPSARPFSCDNRRFGAITAELLTVIFLAANFVPNIWDAFQFTGSSCTGDDVDCGGGGDSCLTAVILVAAAVSPMRPRSSSASSTPVAGKKEKTATRWCSQSTAPRCEKAAAGHGMPPPAPPARHHQRPTLSGPSLAT